jgi:hypothetical protein
VARLVPLHKSINRHGHKYSLQFHVGVKTYPIKKNSVNEGSDEIPNPGNFMLFGGIKYTQKSCDYSCIF